MLRKKSIRSKGWPQCFHLDSETKITSCTSWWKGKTKQKVWCSGNSSRNMKLLSSAPAYKNDSLWRRGRGSFGLTLDLSLLSASWTWEVESGLCTQAYLAFLSQGRKEHAMHPNLSVMWSAFFPKQDCEGPGGRAVVMLVFVPHYLAQWGT